MNNTYWDSWIRPANYNDDLFIYGLRNTPYIAQASTGGTTITWTDHREWTAEILMDDIKCFPFIIMRQKKCSNCGTPMGEEEKAGHIRFDNSDKDYASVSIFLHRKAQQQGMGSKALKHALLRYYGGCKFWKKRVLAFVKADNVGSARFFEKNGFKPVAWDDQVDLITLEYQVRNNANSSTSD